MIDVFSKKDAYQGFAAAVYAYFVLNILYSVLVGVLPQAGETVGLWCVNALIQAALVGVVFLYGRKTGVSPVSAAKLNVRPKILQLLLGVGLGLSVLAFMLPVQNFVTLGLQKLGVDTSLSVPMDTTVGNIIALVLVACIMPAFCEELVFRGVVGNGFAEFGMVKACLAGGALFALFHLNPAQTAHQFVLGGFLVFLVLSTGSLWTSVTVHLVNNLLTVVLSLTVGAEIEAASLKYWYAFMLVGGAVAVAIVLLLAKRSTFVRPEKTTLGGAELTKTLVLSVPALFICVVLWLYPLVSALL